MSLYKNGSENGKGNLPLFLSNMFRTGQQVALFILLLVSLSWASQLVCQKSQHGSASDNRYMVELLPEGVDPARFQVISLQLDMVWSPVLDNRCTVRRHDDRLQMAWGDLGVEFAQYPVKCGETHSMNFSVSTLGTRRWDNRVQRVEDGSVFMPQMGREGMLSVVSRMGDFALPLPLQFRLMSGSLIQLDSLNMTVCFYDLDGLLIGQEGDDDEDELPIVVPFHDCVLRDHTGFCSTNFGYVASKDVIINASKHHDTNRFSPTKWHSAYWKLPETFEKGYHPNQFKVQWPCTGGSDYSAYRVHWHLNGSLATAEYSYGSSCKMTEGIHKMTEQEENDLIAAYTHDDTIIFAPYYSQYNPKFAQRSLGRRGEPVWSECDDECCDGWCSSCDNGCDGWWAFYLFFFFLIGILVLLLIVGCVGPWWGLDATVPYYDHSHQMAYATHPEHIQPIPGSVPTIVSVDHIGHGQISKTQ